VKNKNNNLRKSDHKKKLKQARLERLEKQLKANILKRKNAIKINNG